MMLYATLLELAGWLTCLSGVLVYAWGIACARGVIAAGLIALLVRAQRVIVYMHGLTDVVDSHA